MRNNGIFNLGYKAYFYGTRLEDAPGFIFQNDSALVDWQDGWLAAEEEENERE